MLKSEENVFKTQFEHREYINDLVQGEFTWNVIVPSLLADYLSENQLFNGVK